MSSVYEKTKLPGISSTADAVKQNILNRGQIIMSVLKLFFNCMTTEIILLFRHVGSFRFIKLHNCFFFFCCFFLMAVVLKRKINSILVPFSMIFSIKINKYILVPNILEAPPIARSSSWQQGCVFSQACTSWLM